MMKLRHARVLVVAIWVVATVVLISGCGSAERLQPTPSETPAPPSLPAPTETPAPTPTAANTAIPYPIPGQIAFVSWRNGNQDIYLVNANGTEERQLTNNPEDDYSPVWSLDGSKLAYVSHNADPQLYYSEINIVNADGSGLLRLTGDAYSPAWSPDGKRIAFDSARDGSVEIYTINIDGSGLRRLTSADGFDASPKWSPDGSKIIFVSDRDNPNPDPTYCSPYCNSEIYVMDSDGSNQIRLTNNTSEDVGVMWSPDGSRIAFRSYSSTTGNVVSVMNSDGSTLVLSIPTYPTYPGDPIWSPDGSRFAFNSETGDIYVANIDGSDLTNLTNSEFGGRNPSWSPDGNWIAFTSNREGGFTHEIYVVSVDGKVEFRLTNTKESNGDPVWSPLP